MLESGIENANWLRCQNSEGGKHVTEQGAWTDVDLLVVALIQAS